MLGAVNHSESQPGGGLPYLSLTAGAQPEPVRPHAGEAVGSLDPKLKWSENRFNMRPRLTTEISPLLQDHLRTTFSGLEIVTDGDAVNRNTEDLFLDAQILSKMGAEAVPIFLEAMGAHVATIDVSQPGFIELVGYSCLLRKLERNPKFDLFNRDIRLVERAFTLRAEAVERSIGCLQDRSKLMELFADVINVGLILH